MSGRHDPDWWAAFREKEARQKAELEARRGWRQLSIFDVNDNNDQETTEQ